MMTFWPTPGTTWQPMRHASLGADRATTQTGTLACNLQGRAGKVQSEAAPAVPDVAA